MNIPFAKGHAKNLLPVQLFQGASSSIHTPYSTNHSFALFQSRSQLHLSLQSPASMQLDLKPYFIVLVCVMALLTLFAIARNLLFKKQITAWQNRNDGVMKAIVVTAFVVIAAASVPMILQFFVRTQIRIGNGNLPLVTTLRTQPMHVIRSVWIIFGIGLAIAIPAIIKYDSIPSTSS